VHRRGLAVFALLLLSALGCGPSDALPVPNRGPRVTPTTFFKGMTQAGYTANVFRTKAVLDSLAALKRAHVNTLAIQLGWYQHDPTSTEITPNPQKTPTDASLVQLIRRAHQAGMYVFLNPFVNALTGSAWQATFQPTSWHRWFQSYDRFLQHYAAIAEREHVELFSIGDESDSADTDPALYPEWHRAIALVRRIYHGPITYGADWPNYQRVTFWRDLDYVGIDPYFALAPAGQVRPSLVSLKARWNALADEMDAWRHTSGLDDRPFFIVELGYYSGRGVAAEPAFWRPEAPPDLKAQADCYAATLATVYRRPWLKGLVWFWWANPSNPHWRGGPGDNGYTVRGKPAYRVLAQAFAAPRPYRGPEGARPRAARAPSTA
jgi:hypothetical protein